MTKRNRDFLGNCNRKSAVLFKPLTELLFAPDNDTVWDSGKVTSDRSICIEYDGQSLSAMTKYSWQVSVWDEQGNEYTAILPILKQA